MFGDTWVTPDVLFDPDDPATPGPPPDAVDVQFRVPVSLAVYVDELVRERRRHELAGFVELYQRVVANTVRQIQRNGGCLDATRDLDTRLAMASSVELEVPGVAGTHPHAHVYVGGTATALRDDTIHPVPTARLQITVDGVWGPVYLRRLKVYTSEALEFTWGEPRPGAPDEVLDPPYAEAMAGWSHPVCPGRWGPRHLLLADVDYLEGCAESERQHAEDVRNGTVYQRPQEWTPGTPTWLPGEPWMPVEDGPATSTR